MAKLTNKQILLIIVPIILLALLTLSAWLYVGRETDTLSVRTDQRRYSYDITIMPRKAIQGYPVRVTMAVKDRATKQPAPNVSFNLSMSKYHRFFAQAPTEYFGRHLSTDEKGIIKYEFLPDADSGSEWELVFSAIPSIYRDGDRYIDPDKIDPPQYKNEDISIEVPIKVLPSIASLFRH